MSWSVDVIDGWLDLYMISSGIWGHGWTVLTAIPSLPLPQSVSMYVCMCVCDLISSGILASYITIIRNIRYYFYAVHNSCVLCTHTHTESHMNIYKHCVCVHLCV